MWIAFTTPKGSGFVSVVAKNEKNEHSDHTVCLRFRREEDAAKLIPWQHEVIATPDGDYGWRVYMYKEHFGVLMKAIAENMTYDNFKDSIPADDVAFENACHETWFTMGVLQTDGPYGMFKNRKIGG